MNIEKEGSTVGSIFFLDCIKTRNQFQLVGPSGEPAQPSDPLVLCKPIRQQTFSSGLLILRPLEMKKLQYVKNDTMVSRGRVSFACILMVSY